MARVSPIEIFLNNLEYDHLEVCGQINESTKIYWPIQCFGSGNLQLFQRRIKKPGQIKEAKRWSILPCSFQQYYTYELHYIISDSSKTNQKLAKNGSSHTFD